MEREIKFRAKQLNTGNWVEGDLVHIGNRTCIGGDHLKDGITDVDPSTVCQYTGLKDKDGKEIWEHDLIQSYPLKPVEVVWVYEFASFCLKREDGYLEIRCMGDMLREGSYKRLYSKFDKED